LDLGPADAFRWPFAQDAGAVFGTGDGRERLVRVCCAYWTKVQ